MKIKVKDNTTKLVLVIIVLIVLFAGVFIYNFLKLLNPKGISDKNLEYTKSDMIKLINSLEKKKNYEMEFSLSENHYKIMCFDKKIKQVVTSKEKNVEVYDDLENNSYIMFDNKEMTAVKVEQSFFKKGFYITVEVRNKIENGEFEIEGEDNISGRDAIVLSFEIEDNNFKQSATKKVWIDKDTGLLLQSLILDKSKSDDVDETIVYNLKVNTVKESDVTMPDLSKYQYKEL